MTDPMEFAQHMRLDALRLAYDGERTVDEMLAIADKFVAFIEGRSITTTNAANTNDVPGRNDVTIELQNGEFKAVDQLADEWHRLQMTPVVDDDYPEIRHRYESALISFVEALCDNQRLAPGSRLLGVLLKKQVKVPS